MKDIGHNNPPDPIDEATAPFSDAIAEAENWLDGSPVETEDQMKAVDALIRDVKAAKKAVSMAEESEAKPIYDAWKEAKARYKPTLDDLDRIAKGLASIVGDFKKRLAAEKEEARRQAAIAAAKARQEAEDAARAADAGDIEAQREAADKLAQAKQAEADRIAARNDRVTGLRTVTRYDIEDHRAALHWIAQNDREAVTAFIEEYVRRHHKSANIAGVKVWQDKEAF